jgi:hypothetical protein
MHSTLEPESTSDDALFCEIPPKGQAENPVAKSYQAVVEQTQLHASGKESYLKIRCPSELCKHDMVLICPYCNHGALWVTGDSSLLECRQCKSCMRAITCDCGFTVRASYIREKQKTLERLLSQADGDAYKSIGYLFGLSFLLFMLIVTLS